MYLLFMLMFFFCCRFIHITAEVKPHIVKIFTCRQAWKLHLVAMCSLQTSWSEPGMICSLRSLHITQCPAWLTDKWCMNHKICISVIALYIQWMLSSHISFKFIKVYRSFDLWINCHLYDCQARSKFANENMFVCFLVPTYQRQKIVPNEFWGNILSAVLWSRGLSELEFIFPRSRSWSRDPSPKVLVSVSRPEPRGLCLGLEIWDR